MEVDVGVEGGGDFFCVLDDFRLCDFLGDVFFVRVFLGGFYDLGVVDESVDEDLSFGVVEGAHRESEARVDLCDGVVYFASYVPAYRGHEDPVEGGEDGEEGNQDEYPEGDSYGLGEVYGRVLGLIGGEIGGDGWESNPPRELTPAPLVLKTRAITR